jgi:hypothetical protein
MTTAHMMFSIETETAPPTSPVTGALRPFSEAEVLDMFDPSVYESLRALHAREGVEGLMVYECLDLSSSQLGARNALAYGPACSIKCAHAAAAIHFGDLPSLRKYPIGYWPRAAA